MSKAQKLYLSEQKLLCKLPRKEMHLDLCFPTSNVELPHYEIPSQYKEFEDMFEKKNVDTLPEHRPYDYTIDLKERAQPPYKPIYNLSQDELQLFVSTSMKTLKRGSFDIPSLQLVP
jgi:hypothetical protein